MAVELPNGKIALTLPEQVGKNAKDISDILKLIDGLNVQDSVVVIDDISHIMTTQELKVVKQPVSFLKYNDEIFIKDAESASDATFYNIFKVGPSTNTLAFTTNKIIVNLTNGALSYTNATVTTYSEAYLDSLLAQYVTYTNLTAYLAAKASLSGADFTGGITAPSITEIMEGYSFVPNTTDTSFSKTFKYVSAVKTGNKLTLVNFLAITVGANDIPAYSGLYIGDFIVPAAIGAKLYPYAQGTFTTALAVQFVPLSDSSVSVPLGQGIAITLKSGPTHLFQLIYNQAKLDANKTYLARIETTFLLGDSLI